MKVAYIVFDGITELHFFGIYDAISHLKSSDYRPETTWDQCSFTKSVSDNFALEIKVTRIKNPLTDYDAIIVPGGFATRSLPFNNDFIDWIVIKGIVHE